MTIFPFRRILVGVAHNDADADLLRYASMLARLTDQVEFRFVHVFAGGRSHEAARQQLEQTVREHFSPSENTVVSVHASHGVRVDRLLELATEDACDLILVGHHPDRTGRRSLARRLAMKAPCSVWMAPMGSEARLREVVVAVDFSDPSALAVEVATRLAASARLSRCLALHVCVEQTEAGDEEQAFDALRDEPVTFEQFLAPLDLGGMRVEQRVAENTSVQQAIQNLGAECRADLLVMGSRGASPAAAVLLGSETEHMLREAKAPVLVVKRSGGPLSLLRALFDRDFRPNTAPRLS